MPPAPQDTGISATVFALATVAVIVGLGVLIWFAIPGPDARHRFVSPSGQVVLELGELCREAGCERVIVSEVSALDGSKSRRGCAVPLTERHPVWINAYPLWNADETAVDIVYADAQGVGGKFTLTIAEDCTLATEG